MGLICDSLYQDLLIIFLTISICVYAYFKWSFQYWKRKGIPYLQPTFPFGNIANPILNPKSFADITREQYDEAKSKGYKHYGTYFLHSPVYNPIDLKYVRNIMAKDFDNFVDRGVYYNEKDDPLSATLFSIEGMKWRNLRMKLTPTFTSGKLKIMLHTLTECGKHLHNYMEEICSRNEPIDIKDVSGCFTTDVIASCAFGIDSNSFQDTNSEFRKYLKRVFVLKTSEIVGILVAAASPNLGKLLGIRMIPKEVSDYFRKIIDETVDYREKTDFVRKDFMQLLLELKNNVVEGQRDGKNLTPDELAAQAFIFLAAGFETSSTTMTFCLYELAVNQDIQERLREEIVSILDRNSGNITYDAVMDMNYLNQVIEETLRKYPPLASLSRICVSDYKIPDTDVILKKGTKVHIPVIGLQRDEDYFPNSERFDPERFNEENKFQIPHFSYMPFGEGPRACIGLRFGMMQVKVGLVVLLKSFSFTLNDKTVTPLKMNPASFVLSTLGDVWLSGKKIA